MIFSIKSASLESLACNGKYNYNGTPHRARNTGQSACHVVKTPPRPTALTMMWYRDVLSWPLCGTMVRYHCAIVPSFLHSFMLNVAVTVILASRDDLAPILCDSGLWNCSGVQSLGKHHDQDAAWSEKRARYHSDCS